MEEVIENEIEEVKEESPVEDVDATREVAVSRELGEISQEISEIRQGINLYTHILQAIQQTEHAHVSFDNAKMNLELALENLLMPRP